jgi:hypothetical protein
MKLFLVIVSAAGLIALMPSCKSSTGQAILQPIESAGCDVETAITASFGAEVVSECGGGDAVACGNAFQTALGNANLCSAPLPASASMMDVKGAPLKWSKVGDVPASALKSAPHAMKAGLNEKGVVGSIACPIGINAVMGFLTAVVPPACACKNSMSAGQLSTALVAACAAIVPI